MSLNWQRNDTVGKSRTGDTTPAQQRQSIVPNPNLTPSLNNSYTYLDASSTGLPRISLHTQTQRLHLFLPHKPSISLRAKEFYGSSAGGRDTNKSGSSAWAVAVRDWSVLGEASGRMWQWADLGSGSEFLGLAERKCLLLLRSQKQVELMILHAMAIYHGAALFLCFGRDDGDEAL
jgi:hypothetical protein